MNRLTAITAFLLAASWLAHAGTPNSTTLDELPAIAAQQNTHVHIAGLSACSHETATGIVIQSGQPAVVIVHGLNGHPVHFTRLAKTFTDNGQQAFCFSYNDRASLEKSASALQKAIADLTAHTSATITVVGHSIGGLVAHAALSDKHPSPVASIGNDLQLVTIATPFAGVRKARHCVSTFMKLVTLGLSGPTCRAISGDKWHEITHASVFIREPGLLGSNVSQHLKIATDEQHACKSLLGLGPCLPGGYIFTLQEQFHPLVDEQNPVTLAVIKAGHREIIDSEKLASVLARTGMISASSARRLAVNDKAGNKTPYRQEISL